MAPIDACHSATRSRKHQDPSDFRTANTMAAYLRLLLTILLNLVSGQSRYSRSALAWGIRKVSQVPLLRANSRDRDHASSRNFHGGTALPTPRTCALLGVNARRSRGLAVPSS